MHDILHKLLDRYELNPDTDPTFVKVDFASLQGPAECKRLEHTLRELGAAGAVMLKFGKRTRRDEIDSVKLVTPEIVYRTLDRIPITTRVEEIMVMLSYNAEPWEIPILEDIRGRWLKKKQWNGLDLNSWKRLQDVQLIARPCRAKLHTGLDLRTFSARFGKDSKFFERNNKLIWSYVSFQTDSVGNRDSIQSDVGVRKISEPILMSGTYSVQNNDMVCDLPYCGIPEFLLASTIFVKPAYVLTIENLTSFHRHAIEINEERDGLVLFASGQPSSAFQRLYARLTAEFGSTVPFYHWGDIDGGGLAITKTLIGINPNLKPHLMSIDILRKHGVSTHQALSLTMAYAGTWLDPLARVLAEPEGLVLEQEVIDPSLPNLTST